MKAVCYYDFPLCRIGIAEEGGALTALTFSPVGGDYPETETPLFRRAAGELREYFAGTRREFDLPLAPHGTEFERAVWEALRGIPFGETRSYGDIAAQIGRPKAFRAVGMANHRNPISIFIPCHRVIGRNGALTGYGGGLEVKEALLRLEGCLL